MKVQYLLQRRFELPAIQCQDSSSAMPALALSYTQKAGSTQLWHRGTLTSGTWHVQWRDNSECRNASTMVQESFRWKVHAPNMVLVWYTTIVTVT